MSIKLAGGPTCARALPCVEPAGCTYTHARAMQFLYGRTYVRTDGRTHHVTTKFSRLHGLPYFFKYGAPLRGPSARWRSSAMTFLHILEVQSVQSITNIRSRSFFTFISENLRPSILYLVPRLGCELEKMTSYAQKYLTG